MRRVFYAYDRNHLFIPSISDITTSQPAAASPHIHPLCSLAQLFKVVQDCFSVASRKLFVQVRSCCLLSRHCLFLLASLSRADPASARQAQGRQDDMCLDEVLSTSNERSVHSLDSSSRAQYGQPTRGRRIYNARKCGEGYQSIQLPYSHPRLT